MRVLLTGATGFLGSHIAEALIDNGCELILTKRNDSNLWRCDTFLNKALWVNSESFTWFSEVLTFHPEIIINAAWNGVSAATREDWNIQVDNINFQQQLLELAKNVKLKKFISIGSQAEYGEFNEIIDETYPTNPTTAYGAAKLASSILMQTFCEEHNIGWYWLRVFSVFGEKENEKWLIPSVIKKMLSESNEMDFTLGEQKYAYLYVADFVKSITNVVLKKAPSGIYNISSDKSILLKDLIIMIRDVVNPGFKLNFGAIPYRLNQSMKIIGDSTKFNQAFGQIETTNFNIKLVRVINSYRN